MNPLRRAVASMVRIAQNPTTSNSAIAQAAKAMRMWDLPFVETSTFWLGLGAIFFGVLTAVLTVLAFVYQVRLGTLKDEEYVRFQDESRLGIVSAEARAAEAQERVLMLEAESAKQQERAARAEQSLLELQSRVADRHLTGGQRTRLVERLKHGPKGQVLVQCVGNASEPCAFLTEILSVLTEAGWAVPEDSDFGGIYFGSAPSGLVVDWREGEQQPQRALALMEALREIGFAVTPRTVPNLTSGSVRFTVGVKP